jgi:hypothetical protein
MASIARPPKPFFVLVSGAYRSPCACRRDSQLPIGHPRLDLSGLQEIA